MPAREPRDRQGQAVAQRSGTASGAAVLVVAAAATAGWLWLRRRRQAQAPKGTSSRHKQPRSAAQAASNDASTGAAAGVEPEAPVVLRHPKEFAASRRQGNPKKNKHARRKAQQQEKPGGAGNFGAGMEVLHNIALQEQAAKQQQQQQSTITRYVDTSKTDEVYEKVRQYQETGQKKYP